MNVGECNGSYLVERRSKMILNWVGPPAVRVEKMLRFELLVVVWRGGRWEGLRRINPTPGLARRQRKIVLAERVHVGEDDGHRPTCVGVFL